MGEPQKVLKGSKGDSASEVTDSATGPESLLIYPSLERLFDGNEPKALADMRTQLERRHQELERVIRQGPSEDATRAARIIESYRVTLDLLAELERQLGQRAK